MTAIWTMWFGVLGGMTAWAAHLVTSYAIVALGCAPFGEIPVRALLFGVTLVTGLIAMGALIAARRILPSRTTWRRSFARAGVLLDALAIFGIAVAGTLPFGLRAC